MNSTTILTKKNINYTIKAYLNNMEKIPPKLNCNSIYQLLISLKRKEVMCGPYPKVSLFEAANRILSDLVILYGIKELLFKKSLISEKLPFDKYLVKLSNESGFDLEAKSKQFTLAGEAFNVSQSFFQLKKTAVLKRLRNKGKKYTHRLVLFNDDAISDISRYPLSTKDRILLMAVKIPL